MMLRAEVQLAWKTKAGHRHQVEGLENEDAVFVTHQHPLFDAVLMVADGMGGHPRPREASEAAVRTARECLFNPRRLEEAGRISVVLESALEAAHRAVRALGGGAGNQPGTTLSIALVVEGTLHVAHVGDGSVFLMREGQVQPLAGGEDRRAGNRPAQFLGQDVPLEPEYRQMLVAEGDRVLLCTDGLTRYFREAGPEALERVLGRRGVEPQAVASQLTAHSRPRDYDDDTTVALAEVTALTRAPRRTPTPPPTKEETPLPSATLPNPQPGTPARSPRGSALLTVAAALTGATLLAAGFFAGRGTAPGPAASPGAEPAAVQEVAGPEDLRSLPSGNVVLLDEAGSRVFTLSTRAAPVGSAPVELRAFRVGKTGQFTPAGIYRLDPTRGTLTDTDGRAYPVQTDYSGGAIRVVRGGTLAVNTQPAGARVYVDGHLSGASPQKLTLPAGEYHVRAEGKNWARDARVEVIPGGSVSITLGPQ